MSNFKNCQECGRPFKAGLSRVTQCPSCRADRSHLPSAKEVAAGVAVVASICEFFWNNRVVIAQKTKAFFSWINIGLKNLYLTITKQPITQTAKALVEKKVADAKSKIHDWTAPKPTEDQGINESPNDQSTSAK